MIVCGFNVRGVNGTMVQQPHSNRFIKLTTKIILRRLHFLFCKG